jgi:phenylpyruvate tautomerase PptA (4-oxalocrotonate tautomerase family)
MPLVKINVRRGRTSSDKDAIAAAIHTAMVDRLHIPVGDRFQLFVEFDAENFRHTDEFMGVSYSDQLLIIEITMIEGRDEGVRRSLLSEITANLVAAQMVSADDVFVVLTEIGAASISFGQGLAQRAG